MPMEKQDMDTDTDTGHGHGHGRRSTVEKRSILLTTITNNLPSRSSYSLQVLHSEELNNDHTLHSTWKTWIPLGAQVCSR